jgi:hypothetical protein
VADGLHLARSTTVPAGHQLLLAEITGPATGKPVSGYSDGVRIAVTDGTDSRDIRGGAVALTNGTLAVVLPADAEPVLVITDAGRAQSLDLVSGRRGKDAVAGYYPVRRGEYESSDATDTGLRLYGAAVAALSSQERLAAVGLNDMPASLMPWVEGRGWAKPGRSWLVLEASVGYGRASASVTDPDVVVVPVSCFAARGSGGRIALSGEPIRIGEGGSPTSPAAGYADTTLVGDVPASLREVTVVFTFRGAITTPQGPVTYSPYANPTQTARITLA